MAFGIFFGPNKPTQTVESKLVKPFSAIVGISANPLGLLLPDVAKAFSLPLLNKGIAFEILVIVYKASFDATAKTDSGPPL